MTINLSVIKIRKTLCNWNLTSITYLKADSIDSIIVYHGIQTTTPRVEGNSENEAYLGLWGTLGAWQREDKSGGNIGVEYYIYYNI